ncbi:MAG: aminopeptidase P N-terminal domain-containing protein [Pseudomonadota bacterium]|nr:aminopeptidase P N-terminal domain-containing protein [Pseudomonadota bacterium]
MKSNIYQKRRAKLLGLMEKESVVIIESATEKIRNNDVFYDYRQNSNFFYLTGHDEPDAVLILTKKKGKNFSFFFTKEPSKIQETWTGPIDNAAKLKKKLSVNVCEYLTKIKDMVNDIIQGSDNVYHSLSASSNLYTLVNKSIKSLEKKYRQGAHSPSKIFSLDKILHRMRLIKSQEEIKEIKKACLISVKAHKRLMKNCSPGMTEYQIEAELMHEFHSSDAKEAYPSIVASGKNACILHYTKNNSLLKNGQLLLTDAAAEYKNYASDITRTIPISGKFNKSQKLIYEIVLNAQKKAIKKCVVGNYWSDIHREAVRVLTKGLMDIGLIKGKLADAINKQKYEKFYMHSTGHWLGLDVHDPCEYSDGKKALKLKAGMVFTVEPGIYIKPQKSIPSIFHNIGIRIEDDILITSNGPVVLTSSLPKETNDIERIMSSNG